MRGNHEAWRSGLPPLVVGGDMESAAVQEFSRALFNMRPDISLSVAQTICRSEVRQTVPCDTGVKLEIYLRGVIFSTIF
ncbi:hypothetical protein GQ457_09G010820 [Hibiscus cannabinus]